MENGGERRDACIQWIDGVSDGRGGERWIRCRGKGSERESLRMEQMIDMTGAH